MKVSKNKLLSQLELVLGYNNVSEVDLWNRFPQIFQTSSPLDVVNRTAKLPGQPAVTLFDGAPDQQL